MSYRRQVYTLAPDRCRQLVALAEAELDPPPSRAPERSPNGEHYSLSGHLEVQKLFRPQLGVLPWCRGPWVYADLLTLYPAGVIHQHTDTTRGCVRTHIVLQTNEDCWNFSGGVWAQLPLGSVWEMDTTQPHGSINWGKHPRIHLLFDVQP